jgi:hypothetical protein
MSDDDYDDDDKILTNVTLLLFNTESPAPSPQHTTHTLQSDMHSRLEMYASRLAQVEGGTRSNSTPDSDDEHHLANQSSISSSNGPKSPNNETEEREELESIIRDLEDENASLQAEYERLKTKQTPTTTPEDSDKTPGQTNGQGGVSIIRIID